MDITPQQSPQSQLAYTVPEACEAARVGRAKLYIAIASGALTVRKLGKKSLILHDDLKLWLQDLPKYDPQAPKHTPVKANQERHRRLAAR